MVRMMLEQWRLFLMAVMFYTRIPVPGWVGHDEAALGRASRYLSLIGVLVGLVCGLVFLFLHPLLPIATAVIVSVGAGMVLTGALHEDGFADFCDGFGGGMNRADVFRIMKDSQVGVFGVLGLGVLVAIKVSLLIGLAGLDVGQVLPSLVVGHSVSRMYAAGVMTATPYVVDRENTKAHVVSMEGFARADFLIVAGVAVAGLILLFPLGVLAIAALPFAGALVMARWMMHRIGGHTGDTLGAVQQVCECLTYVAIYAGAAA